MHVPFKHCNPSAHITSKCPPMPKATQRCPSSINENESVSCKD